MTRLLPRLCAALATVLVVLGTAVAGAQAPTDPAVTTDPAAAPSPAPATQRNFFAADTTVAGVISLDFFGAEGQPVVFYERVGDKRERLGVKQAANGAPTEFKGAVTWRCDRLVRAFEATSTLPDGTLATGAYSVRTPSCATRFDLDVPQRLAVGHSGTVRVVDRWSNGGVTPLVCIVPPHAKRDCAKLRLARAIAVGTRSFTPAVAGRWHAEVRIRGHIVRRAIAVGAHGSSAKPPPTLLATGDSTMQGTDSFLSDELGDEDTVKSDVRPGTGISKPGTNWVEIARAQTKRLHPATTVVSIGASEGFPMAAADGSSQTCCGPGWIAVYERKVRSMMKSYRRDGHGRVIWLTLPLPDGATYVTQAVNQAILSAAQGLDHVSVLRMDLLFTPNGFQSVIRYRGRNVRVREPDGIHLNIAGSAIAAKVVAAALRDPSSGRDPNVAPPAN